MFWLIDFKILLYIGQVDLLIANMWTIFLLQSYINQVHGLGKNSLIPLTT